MNYLFFFLKDDLEIFFIEDDYRRRKLYFNFKEYISVEKIVIKFGKIVCFFLIFVFVNVFIVNVNDIFCFISILEVI